MQIPQEKQMQRVCSFIRKWTTKKEQRQLISIVITPEHAGKGGARIPRRQRVEIPRNQVFKERQNFVRSTSSEYRRKTKPQLVPVTETCVRHFRTIENTTLGNPEKTASRERQLQLETGSTSWIVELLFTFLGICRSYLMN